MRYGISTHLYHERRLERAHLLELAEFGFREIELFATVGHFDYHDERAIDGLGKWLSAAGITLHSVHAPIVEHRLNGRWGPALSTAASAEQARALAVAEAQAAARIARHIPYSFLVVHLGVPESPGTGEGENSVAAARRSLEEIGTCTAGLGLTLAVEVIPNRLSAAERLVQVLEDEVELPPPGAGICLDMGHAFLMGDVADTIDIVSGHLVTTHVHDNSGTADDHVAPFEGGIDWPTALMSLQKVGYEGSLVFELANTGNPRTVLQKSVEVRQRFEDILRD